MTFNMLSDLPPSSPGDNSSYGSDSGMFRRFSPKSYKSSSFDNPFAEGIDKPIESSAHHFGVVEDDTSLSTAAGAERHSDLERGGGGGGGYHNSKRSNRNPSTSNTHNASMAYKKRVLLVIFWLLLSLGLIVGLNFAFRGTPAEKSATSSKQSSDTNTNNNHDTEVPIVDKTKVPIDQESIFEENSQTKIPGWEADPFPTNSSSSNAEGKSENTRDDEEKSNIVESATTTAPTMAPTIATDKSRDLDWPEMVGMTGEDAKAKLQEMYGLDTYQIYIVYQYDPVTRDFRWDRIRLFVDEQGIVVYTPRIG